MLKCIAVIAILALIPACHLKQKRVTIEAPRDAKDTAIEVIKTSGECRALPVRCTDFKILCSNPVELGALDKANGVTEKWCLKISYSYDYQGKRYSGPTDALLTYAHGEWGVEFLYHQNRHCECKAD
jgi:hypothetical protein